MSQDYIDLYRRVAAYTRVRSWIHIILTKKNIFSKKNVVWNSAAFARSDNYHTEYFINHIA